MKLLQAVLPKGRVRSHPSRGGWIEIFCAAVGTKIYIVPPLTGWVD